MWSLLDDRDRAWRSQLLALLRVAFLDVPRVPLPRPIRIRPELVGGAREHLTTQPLVEDGGEHAVFGELDPHHAVLQAAAPGRDAGALSAGAQPYGNLQAGDRLGVAERPALLNTL